MATEQKDYTMLDLSTVLDLSDKDMADIIWVHKDTKNFKDFFEKLRAKYKGKNEDFIFYAGYVFGRYVEKNQLAFSVMDSLRDKKNKSWFRRLMGF